MHLLFKITFSRKTQVNIKYLKYIPKSHKKVQNSNILSMIVYETNIKILDRKIKKPFGFHFYLKI
jgi:hypothetical protein